MEKTLLWLKREPARVGELGKSVKLLPRGLAGSNPVVPVFYVKGGVNGSAYKPVKLRERVRVSSFDLFKELMK